MWLFGVINYFNILSSISYHGNSFSLTFFPVWGLLYIFRIKGKSTLNDFILAAQVCLPIISAVLVETKNPSYPRKCFLNVDVPNDVANHKVYYNYFCNLYVFLMIKDRHDYGHFFILSFNCWGTTLKFCIVILSNCTIIIVGLVSY